MVVIVKVVVVLLIVIVEYSTHVVQGDHLSLLVDAQWHQVSGSTTVTAIKTKYAVQWQYNSFLLFTTTTLILLSNYVSTFR